MKLACAALLLTIHSLQLDATEQPLDGKTLYQILLADIAVQRGEHALAAQAYLEVARASLDPRLARRASEAAYAAKDFSNGLAAAELWVKLEPDSVRPKQVAAFMLLNQGKLSEAKAYLVNAFAALDPEQIGAEFLQLSRLLNNQQDKDTAFQLVRELAEPYPDIAEVQYALAAAGLNTGLKELTVTDISAKAADRALAMREGWEPAAFLKAQILSKTSPERAIEFLQNYLSAKPEARQLRLALAQLLIQQKRYAESRALFTLLAEQWPDPREMWLAAAQVSVLMRDYDHAEMIYQRLLKTESSDQDTTRLNLAQLYEERKQYDQAIAQYRAIEGEQRWNAQLRIALALAKTDSLQAAQAHLVTLAATTDQQQTQLIQTEATLLREADQAQQAYTLLEEALKKHPDSPELLYDFAMIAEKLDRLEVLENNLRKLIDLKPDSAHAYNALGYTLVDRTSKVDEGMRYIEKALQLAPDDPFILDSAGWGYFRQGKLEQALRYLRRAMDLRPDPEIAAHLGEILWVMGERTEAEKIWREQLRETPEHRGLNDTIKRFIP